MQDVSEYCEYPYVTYSYKIIAKDNRGNRSLKSERGLVSGYYIDCGEESEDRIFSEDNSLPMEFSIRNYPNPFNPVTNIVYNLPKDEFVKIKIYDALGKEIMTIVNEFKEAGKYNVSFNGVNFSSGIYYYRIEAGSFIQTKKMLLIK